MGLTQTFTDLVESLEQAGYDVITMLLYPRTYSIPQRRLRLYILATLQDIGGMSFEDKLPHASAMVSFAKSQDILPLNRFLLHEESDDYAVWDRTVLF